MGGGECVRGVVGGMEEMVWEDWWLESSGRLGGGEDRTPRRTHMRVAQDVHRSCVVPLRTQKSSTHSIHFVPRTSLIKDPPDPQPGGCCLTIWLNPSSHRQRKGQERWYGGCGGRRGARKGRREGMWW